MNNYFLVFIFSSFALAFFLLSRYRGRRYAPLILAIAVLIFLNVILVGQLATQTFKSQLNCATLIDRSLNMPGLSPCQGISTAPIGPIEILPPFNIGPITTSEAQIGPFTIPAATYGPWPIGGFKLEPWTIPILPGLAKTIDPLLADFRPFLAWSVLLCFALASLFLTIVGRKIVGFVRLIQSPAGLRAVLTHLNLWLLFFVSLCGLFYVWVVVSP
jgi:hypothetical protein